MVADRYTSDQYLEANPEWHVPESPWKVSEIMRMLTKHHLTPETICEVGCGAGEVLRLLQGQMGEACRFCGYEVSPHAYQMCQQRANDRLQFKLADIQNEPDVSFDLLLLLDVVEHVEDYFTFLRNMQAKGNYKIIHLPLDLSVRAILRGHLVEWRKQFGHIHYFTRELALQSLRELGYEVIDYCYTREPALFPPDDPSTSRSQLARIHLGQAIWQLRKLPAKACFPFAPDLTVRVFGDWRLLVLAQ